MHKDAIVVLCRLINEILNFIGNLITLIKQQLPVVVEPVKGEVFDTHRSPLILDLSPSTVHDVRDLVDCQEFEVLGGVLIAEEQPVFDLDSAENFMRLEDW